MSLLSSAIASFENYFFSLVCIFLSQAKSQRAFAIVLVDNFKILVIQKKIMMMNSRGVRIIVKSHTYKQS